MKTLDRRTFLRGAGGIAIALPFLEIMRPKKASAAGGPKRFLSIFSPNGMVTPDWDSSAGSETLALAPGSVLEPLGAHTSDLLLLTGINLNTAKNQPGFPHNLGVSHGLTGQFIVPDPTIPTMEGDRGFANGPSIDQVIANQVGSATKFGSLQFGVQTEMHGGNPLSFISYTGPLQPIPSEPNPQKAFDRIFMDIEVGDPAALATLRAQRHSVLDFVKGSFDSLNPKLGVSDRQKLDQHLTQVREIEKRIDLGAVGENCSVPPYSPVTDYNANENYPAVTKLMMDMIVMSFACDLTRVSTLQWSAGNSYTIFGWLGQSADHHEMSHSDFAFAEHYNQLVALNRWYAEQLAALIQAMKDVPEGDGSMFDSTVILWWNELARGNAHDFDNMPYLLAGSCSGYFNTGRHLHYEGASHNDLLVSLLNAMDLPDQTFGVPEYCTGPLPGLTA